jgi:CheY-like chemotaxis protein
MAMGYVLVGMFAGAIGFLGAIVFGSSPWSAFLTYSLVGVSIMLVVPLARFAMRASRSPALPHLETGPRVTPPIGHIAPSPSDVAVSALQPITDKRMKILAVDDDPFILELVPKIAANVGFPDITTVSSGSLAMHLIERSDRPFDCLLLDINMPGMDGVELCSRIRCTAGYDDVSIIMLTAMTDIQCLERAFRAGATDYTSKPFDIIEFGERLRSAQTWTAVRRAASCGTSRLPAVEVSRRRSCFQVLSTPRFFAIGELCRTISCGCQVQRRQVPTSWRS